MIELEGKYAKAKVFTDNIDALAISQVIEMLNADFIKDSKVRIMSDVHPGKGCVIGTTLTIKDKVVPNLVGVDIGCGVTTCILGDVDIDFKALDTFIRETIPHGYNVHDKEDVFENLNNLKCINHIDKSRALRSVGTLGGGNHYVEIGEDDAGIKYLMIHSGSRYLGKQIAEYYQDKAVSNMNINDTGEIIEKLKAEGRHKEIESTIQRMKPKGRNKKLAYLEGQDLFDYLHDMKIAKHYAFINRYTMAAEILEHLNIIGVDHFDTVHNYIEDRMLRKGAVSAKKDERLLIPINMRDGAILARGKGNPDWNYSAPHGAGRLFSRGKAKETTTLEEFQESMKGIYSTSVREDTIDESPFAYKDMAEIIENTKDTIDIISIIKPLYNFKA